MVSWTWRASHNQSATQLPNPSVKLPTVAELEIPAESSSFRLVKWYVLLLSHRHHAEVQIRLLFYLIMMSSAGSRTVFVLLIVSMAVCGTAMKCKAYFQLDTWPEGADADTVAHVNIGICPEAGGECAASSSNGNTAIWNAAASSFFKDSPNKPSVIRLDIDLPGLHLKQHKFAANARFLNGQSNVPDNMLGGRMGFVPFRGVSVSTNYVVSGTLEGTFRTQIDCTDPCTDDCKTTFDSVRGGCSSKRPRSEITGCYEARQVCYTKCGP